MDNWSTSTTHPQMGREIVCGGDCGGRSGSLLSGTPEQKAVAEHRVVGFRAIDTAVVWGTHRILSAGCAQVNRSACVSGIVGE
jgi:hypothetical protein